MAYTIPAFSEIDVEGGGASYYPGHLQTVDAELLECIHEELLCQASNTEGEIFERSVCKAIQQCYDLLKGIHARSGPLKRRILESALPPKILTIALECGWLPKEICNNANVSELKRWEELPPHWRDWIMYLLGGRLSRIGLKKLSSPQLYRFAPFPTPSNNAKDVVKAPAANVGDTRKAFVESILAEKGWTIFEWATNASIDFHTANNYLKGKTKPYPFTRMKMAKSLGVDIKFLPK